MPKPKPKRHIFALVMNILEVLQEPKSFYQVVITMRSGHRSVKTHLQWLYERQLVEYNHGQYVLSERGRTMLALMRVPTSLAS